MTQNEIERLAVCDDCGATFMPDPKRRYRKSRFCSRTCNLANLARMAPQRRTAFQKRNDENIRDRLDALTTKQADGCWIWRGTTPNGYGRIRYAGRYQQTHRVAYQLAHGEIPPGMLVCHKCDVPTCINPDHLFLGLPKDNVADMIRKGRVSFHAAKLNHAQVLEIKALIGRKSAKAIAADYSVNPTTIDRIAAGKTWRALKLPE